MQNQPPFDWNTIRRVLFIRLRSIGDTVLCTPSIEALKRWRPEVEIDVLSEPLSAPVLGGNPYLTNLEVIPRSGGRVRWEVIRRLRQRRYDLVLNLHGGTTALLIGRYLNARRHVVFGHLPLPWLGGLRMPHPYELWGGMVHNAEYQLAMLKWLGAPVEPRPPSTIMVDPDATERVERRLTDLGIGHEFAVLHTATIAQPSKQWDSARFARVIDHLDRQHGLPAILIGIPSERAVLDSVAGAARHAFILNDLSLAETIALIARARLFLGNDSGPAHIAAAVKTPVAVIFGPTRAIQWRPWTTAPNRVITPDPPLNLGVCPRGQCKICGTHPRCLESIAVDQVITAVDELLAEDYITPRIHLAPE